MDVYKRQIGAAYAQVLVGLVNTPGLSFDIDNTSIFPHMSSRTDSTPEMASKSSKPETSENPTSTSPQNVEPSRLSPDYMLPHAVKARVDGNYSLASAIAIVSALFAAVMIGMGQIISGAANMSAAWEAVQVLVYGSVIANLTSATCAMWIMAMCSDLPQKSQRLSVTVKDSWPARVVAGEMLEGNLLEDEYALLTAFGMYESYARMEYLQLLWLIVGLVSMFSAITLWSWVAQTYTVAGALLIFVLPALLCALYPIWFLLGETRREMKAARSTTSSPPSA